MTALASEWSVLPSRLHATHCPLLFPTTCIASLRSAPPASDRSRFRLARPPNTPASFSTWWSISGGRFLQPHPNFFVINFGRTLTLHSSRALLPVSCRPRLCTPPVPSPLSLHTSRPLLDVSCRASSLAKHSSLAVRSPKHSALAVRSARAELLPRRARSQPSPSKGPLHSDTYSHERPQPSACNSAP